MCDMIRAEMEERLARYLCSKEFGLEPDAYDNMDDFPNWQHCVGLANNYLNAAFGADAD